MKSRSYWQDAIYQRLDKLLSHRAVVDYDYAMNMLRAERYRAYPFDGPWSFNPSDTTLRRWVRRWLSERYGSL